MEKINVLIGDQKKAFQKVIAADDFFVLNGYAGTGKTFTMREVVREISSSKDITLAAPTHKALSVLTKMVGLGVRAMTLQSYLGLVVERFGVKEKLVKGWKYGENPKLDEVLIVDEASMVNSEVMEFILDTAATFFLTVIFVGDPAQLPPVKEQGSPAFTHNFDSFCLTEIKRQAKDNPIIELASVIRKCDDVRKINFNELAAKYDGSEHIFFRKADNGKNNLHDFFSRHPLIGDAVAIAWRNDRVNYANNQARCVYFNTPAPYSEGDLLILNEPVAGSDKTRNNFKNADTVRIVSEPQEKYYDGHACYGFRIENHNCQRCNILTLHDPIEEAAYKSKLGKLQSKYRKTRDRKISKQFWALKDAFTSVSYGYSFTTHKAQGSTFKHVAVAVSDLLEMIGSDDDRRRLLYTAVTRAADTLTLIV